MNIVRTSIGGTKGRVRLTNEFGRSSLRIEEARLSLFAPGSKRSINFSIRFNGRHSTIIPAGRFSVSDPIEAELPPLARLTISLYLPRQTIAVVTCHEFAASTNFIARGNILRKRAAKKQASTSWHFLKGIDVLNEGSAFSVVALGDSITDGMSSTVDANRRWPDFLAAKFQAHDLSHVGIVNAGIIGNRVLRDQVGHSAISRFDRDVLGQPGVRCLVLLEGINDIDWVSANENISKPDELIAGLSHLIARAHERSIFVIGGTILPYYGAEGYSEAGNAIRNAVNMWYRTSRVVDGLADFDQALRDPHRPQALNAKFDSGDHVHPNDAGYEAMANSIDPELIRSCGKKRLSSMPK